MRFWKAETVYFMLILKNLEKLDNYCFFDNNLKKNLSEWKIEKYFLTQKLKVKVVFNVKR